MGRPGEQRAEGHRDQAVGRDRAHENAQARDILVRRDDLEELGQRDEHEPEPDGDAADVAAPGASRPEHRHPRQQEQRRQPRHVERQGLHDQRRADVGPEHHRERGDERDKAGAANEAIIRPVAVLL